MGTRKRCAPFLLEKPLVSRLRFDRELTECKLFLPAEQSRILVHRSNDHSCRTASLHGSAGSATAFPACAATRKKLEVVGEGNGAERDAGEIEWCPWHITREKRKEGEVSGGATAAADDADTWRAMCGRAGPSLLGRRRDDQSESQAGCGREKSSEKEAEAVDAGKLSLAIWWSSCDYMKVTRYQTGIFLVRVVCDSKSAPISSLKNPQRKPQLQCTGTKLGPNTEIQQQHSTSNGEDARVQPQQCDSAAAPAALQCHYSITPFYSLITQVAFRPTCHMPTF